MLDEYIDSSLSESEKLNRACKASMLCLCIFLFFFTATSGKSSNPNYSSTLMDLE